jgi:hypothetical protein
MSQKKSQTRNLKAKNALPLVVCECGFEILLTSDLVAMGKLIEVHALEHGKKEKDPKKAAIEVERVENDLIAQTFKQINRMKIK